MKSFLTRLGRLLWPQRARLALGVVGGLVFAASNPLLMFAVKLTCDLLFPAGDNGELTSFSPALNKLWPMLQTTLNAWQHQNSDGLRFAIIAGIPAAMLLRLLGSYVNFYFLSRAANQAIHELRVTIFDHLLRLPVGYFTSARTGDLISRIASDTDALKGVVQTSLGTLIKEPLTILFLLAYLVLGQPQLTLISLIVFPLCVVPVVIYGRKVRKAAKATSLGLAQMSDTMQEAFTGQRVVKAYNLEPEFSRRFAAVSNHIVGQIMRTVRGHEIPSILVEFSGSIGVALLFLFVMRNRDAGGAGMRASDFFTFIGSVFLLYQPIKNISRFYGLLQQARAASDRIDDVLQTPVEVADPPSPKPLRAVGAAVHFDAITFGYGAKLAVQDIELTVPAGQMVALVGPSGSGKTTLTSLLLRFYDPQQGAVRIGNVDLREVSLRQLRDQIAVVTQETILFNDSVRANIRLGRPAATDAEVEAAARAAQAHEFIMAKPDGYDFVIGERGGNLSGGQRQRLAIARAILKNAPILILDEATSALDTESERAVQLALETLMRGRTTLCIAHRLSTIQHADMIVVMEQGRIIERGHHDDLLARGRPLRPIAFAAIRLDSAAARPGRTVRGRSHSPLGKRAEFMPQPNRSTMLRPAAGDPVSLLGRHHSALRTARDNPRNNSAERPAPAAAGRCRDKEWPADSPPHSR